MTTSQPHPISGRPSPDDGARLSDLLWARIAPMVPPRPHHPRRGHNPRLPDRQVLDGILLMYRSRCRWADLPRLGLCSASPAFRRLREWSDAGFMAALRDLHDPELDALAGPGWIGPTRRKRPPELRE